MEMFTEAEMEAIKKCKWCKGSGYDSYSETDCPDCEGSGLTGGRSANEIFERHIQHLHDTHNK